MKYKTYSASVESMQEEIDTLRRQLAETEGEIAKLRDRTYRDTLAYGKGRSAKCARLTKRAEAAESKLALAEQDARRYRWLRDNCKREWESDMAHDKGAPSLDIDFTAKGHCLDTAIDAAIAAGEGIRD